MVAPLLWRFVAEHGDEGEVGPLSGFTKRIDGTKRRESAALLDFLFEHDTAPEFTCRFRWRPNSIAMWDNRRTQHRVVTDNLRAHRSMERVTICGDEPC